MCLSGGDRQAIARRSLGDIYPFVFITLPSDFVTFSPIFRQVFYPIGNDLQLLFAAFLVDFIPNSQDLAHRDQFLDECVDRVAVQPWPMQLFDVDGAAARVNERANPDVEPFLSQTHPDGSGDPLVRREVDTTHLAQRHGAIRPLKADAGDAPAGFPIRREPAAIRRRCGPPPSARLWIESLSPAGTGPD